MSDAMHVFIVTTLNLDKVCITGTVGERLGKDGDRVHDSVTRLFRAMCRVVKTCDGSGARSLFS